MMVLSASTATDNKAMSDSGSVSSSSSLGMNRVEEQDSLAGNEQRPNSLQVKGSLSLSSARRGSSQSNSSDTPSKESIGAALDEYVSASREGRQAYSTGNLAEAVKEFDHALDIEFQTELECLYDTSIGLVSGLVRREVDSRLDRQGKYHQDEPCSKILQHLRGSYEQAAEEAKGKRSPQWHLQMGAALVVINEWEKAKAIYTEGISVCKERKKLKMTLKNLIKIEQITSYAEIPAEDQPDKKEVPPPSNSPLQSPRSYRRERNRSSSVGMKLIRYTKRERTSSLGSDLYSPADSNVTARSLTRYSPPVTRKENKRLSYNFFNKRSSVGLSLSRSPSIASQEEVELWSSCFEPSSCVVVGQTEFQPSAITHMRRLASVGGDREEDETNSVNLSFTAVNQTSLTIE